MAIHIQSFHGEQAKIYVSEVAQLRIDLFRNFPYLYDGSTAYEEKYLHTLIEAPENIIVMAFEDNAVVGAACALPMRYETLNIQQPLIDKGYDIDQIYYFGESIIRPSHRNRGFGKEFFRIREEWAQGLGWYDFITFCNIERSTDHPAKNLDYKAPDEYWKSLGFQPTDMFCQIAWKELSEANESPKPLRFWMKEIDNR